MTVLCGFAINVFRMINMAIRKGTEGIFLYGLVLNNLNAPLQRVPVLGISTNMFDTIEEKNEIVVNFKSSDDTLSDIRFMTNVYASFKEKYPNEMIRINSFGSSSGRVHWGLFDMSCGDSDQHNSYFTFRRASIAMEPIENQSVILNAIITENTFNILKIENYDVNDTRIELNLRDLNIPENHSITQLWCPIDNYMMFDVEKFNALKDLYLYTDCNDNIDRVPELKDDIHVHLIHSR